MKSRCMIYFMAACTLFLSGCSGQGAESQNQGIDSQNQFAESQNQNADSQNADSQNADNQNQAADSQNRDAGKTEEADDAAISINEAKKAALDHVGLSETDGAWKKEEVDREDGNVVYELEFVSGKTEHDFEFDAKTGYMLEYGKESLYD